MGNVLSSWLHYVPHKAREVSACVVPSVVHAQQKRNEEKNKKKAHRNNVEWNVSY